MRNKKSPKADLEKHRMIYLQIGLIIAASVSLVAFEWRVADGTPRYVQLEEVPYEDDIFDVTIPEDEPEKTEPQRQVQPTPPAPDPDPAPPMPDPSPDPGPEPDPGPGYDPVIPPGTGVPQGKPNEVPVDPVTLQVQPEFPGGLPAMYKFLGDNIKYPREAMEIDVQGKVYVEFIIGKDGAIESARILKGIGAGCDEEAERVVKLMPNWSPGEQFGNKVRVKYILPIDFRLK